MRFFITMLTSADNESADVGRVLLLFLSVSFVLLVSYDMIVHGRPLDYMGFGAGVAGILGGGGAGLMFKHRTEPGAYQPNDMFSSPRPPPMGGQTPPADPLPEPDPARIPRGAR